MLPCLLSALDRLVLVNSVDQSMEMSMSGLRSSSCCLLFVAVLLPIIPLLYQFPSIGGLVLL